MADLWVNLGSAMALSSVTLGKLSSQPWWAVLQNGYKHPPKTMGLGAQEWGVKALRDQGKGLEASEGGTAGFPGLPRVQG